jgi:L-rhamnose mutarotase
VERIAFQLRIRPDKIEQYEETHRHVWPDLLRELASFGITEYSIFRRGQQLFLTMHVPDFQLAQRQLAASDVNRRWQEYMAPLMEPVPDLAQGEELAMMREVFYMRGGPDEGEQDRRTS